MKRFSAPPGVYADPSRPPDDDDSDASSLSDGSKKVKTAQSFESLFNSESLSDIVLDINDGEFVFHAHKMIVGLKSERLAALITSVTSSVPPDNNSGSGNKPVLYLHEPVACSAVFSRFLYFIYSGAVWLHRDYVIPLFKLSIKYGVGALATHCENYIQQILHKMLHQDPASPLTQSLTMTAVCDLAEETGYRDETKRTAFHVLCMRFTDLVRMDRWIALAWRTVRDLLRSDETTCEENLILVSATDWMKRNRLQDKARIQDILSSIRYPRLPRRVLYHLHATASFKKFPPVQDLIDAAIRYHCFKDVSEAQGEFTGLQYRARGCGCGNNSTTTNTTTSNNHTNNRNARLCDGENNAMCITTTVGGEEEEEEDNNNTLVDQRSEYDNCTTTTTCNHSNNNNNNDPGLLSSSCQPVGVGGGGGGGNGGGNSRTCFHKDEENQDLLNNITTSSTASTLPLRQRSRSEDRHASPQRPGHRPRACDSRDSHDSRGHPPPASSSRRQGFPLESSSLASSFHSACSPVAAVQPRVQGQGQRNSSSLHPAQEGEGYEEEEEEDEEDGIQVDFEASPPPAIFSADHHNNNHHHHPNNHHHHPNNHHHHRHRPHHHHMMANHRGSDHQTNS